jgi:competence protein ComEC
MEEVESCVVVGKKFDFFGSIRTRIAEVLYRGMDIETASVTMAVLTGNTAGIEDGLLENMRYGGIAHIFAVSGLHVGDLFAFCLFFTSKTPLRKMPKIARFFLVAFLLIFYGGICGFSASVIRATVLCLVGYAAKLLGVSVDRFEALGVGGVIVLLISPVELFSPGFQLSFLACLGI